MNSSAWENEDLWGFLSTAQGAQVTRGTSTKRFQHPTSSLSPVWSLQGPELCAFHSLPGMPEYILIAIMILDLPKGAVELGWEEGKAIVLTLWARWELKAFCTTMCSLMPRDRKVLEGLGSGPSSAACNEVGLGGQVSAVSPTQESWLRSAVKGSPPSWIP